MRAFFLVVLSLGLAVLAGTSYGIGHLIQNQPLNVGLVDFTMLAALPVFGGIIGATMALVVRVLK